MSECENSSLQAEESLQQEMSNVIPPEDKSTGEHEPDNSTPESIPEEVSPYLTELMKDLEKCADAEAKLLCIIAFMESSLSQTGTPHFRSFWDSRKLCLPLFKAHIAPAVRSNLWEKYTALSKEARRLKEVLNEQSAFAEEQILIAIEALETEMVKIERLHAEGGVSHELPIIQCQALQAKQDFYATSQNLLSLLNASATRINALRKELIKTEMRVRKKNQFFQKLSAAGDRVFPLRKEMIKQVSDQFMADVDAYITAEFASDRMRDSIFNLREEIKSLQSIAKVLTLNAQAFNQTRLRLSECWDRLKGLDKERKQQRAEQKAVFQQNAEAIVQKIDLLQQGMQDNKHSIEDIEKHLREITGGMRQVELGREEIQMLRTKLDAIRQPLQAQREREEQERQHHERERVRLKLQKVQDLKEEVRTLIENAPSLALEDIVTKREELIQIIQVTDVSRFEKDEIERNLKQLRDIIADKKEQSLMTLSDDDRQALQQLRELLKQRKERRQEIKDTIETLRKVKAVSGLDFERAMTNQMQLDEEKERLEKMNQGIEEIEAKIAVLEDQ